MKRFELWMIYCHLVSTDCHQLNNLSLKVPRTFNSKTSLNLFHVFNFIRKTPCLIRNLCVETVKHMFISTSHLTLLVKFFILFSCYGQILWFPCTESDSSLLSYFPRRCWEMWSPAWNCLVIGLPAFLSLAPTRLQTIYTASDEALATNWRGAHILSFWVFDLLITHNETSLSKQNLSTAYGNLWLFELKITWLVVMIANYQAKILLGQM